MLNKKVKRKKAIKRNTRTKIEPDQLILQARQILLFGVIDEQMAYKVIKQLLTLDKLSHNPITLMINSGGGNVYDGFAIIDTIRGIVSPVITVITGKACSMAGLISVVGEVRVMTSNSVWMAHDAATANYDYVTKFLARADHNKELQKRLFTHLAKYTKLSQTELTKARNEELWIYAEDCQKKGIVDKVIK
jgi:ATP-dependent Clp protease protease subunit